MYRYAHIYVLISYLRRPFKGSSLDPGLPASKLGLPTWCQRAWSHITGVAVKELNSNYQKRIVGLSK